MRSIFISGAGRSGTSLLHSLLATSNSICALPETSIVRRHLLSPFSRSSIHALHNDSRLSRLAVSTETLALLSRELTVEKSILAIIDAHISMSIPHQKDGIEFICDKDPLYTFHVPALSRLAPDSFLIHIIRDPIDTVYSRMKADWSSHQSIFYSSLITSAAQLYCHLMSLIFFRNRYFLVEYERLIRDPEQTLNKIFGYLGIPSVSFDKIEQQRRAVSEQLVSSEEMQWKSKILDPIDSSNLGKGHRALPSHVKTVISCICLPYYIIRRHSR